MRHSADLQLVTVSIHARLATGDKSKQAQLGYIGVSIHARLATGDAPRPGYAQDGTVSIHARLATGDRQTRENAPTTRPFQFTPVLRRATRHWDMLYYRTPCFNSRPSCDGRHGGEQPPHPLGVSIHARLATGDRVRHGAFRRRPVSIHARLATGDLEPWHWRATDWRFQFTPVLRRATQAARRLTHKVIVSIHARLATGDRRRSAQRRRAHGVSIHARLATGDHGRVRQGQVDAVSIHARLATGDSRSDHTGSPKGSFNSRPSCDGRQGRGVPDAPVCLVSIHARLATGDDASLGDRLVQEFQFTPVLRRATQRRPRRAPVPGFNSRPSCDGRPAILDIAANVPVSIHARLATGDARFPPRGATTARFNSRPSCDGRRDAAAPSH